MSSRCHRSSSSGTRSASCESTRHTASPRRGCPRGAGSVRSLATTPRSRCWASPTGCGSSSARACSAWPPAGSSGSPRLRTAHATASDARSSASSGCGRRSRRSRRRSARSRRRRAIWRRSCSSCRLRCASGRSTRSSTRSTWASSARRRGGSVRSPETSATGCRRRCSSCCTRYCPRHRHLRSPTTRQSCRTHATRRRLAPMSQSSLASWLRTQGRVTRSSAGSTTG
mmetsp:Transcript_13174/g.34513  ORF Transcript_13174/g.34513 Transcript_13174/m.34513 type:complete len:228 (-) Transcript_13174:1642-2325(-)